MITLSLGVLVYLCNMLNPDKTILMSFCDILIKMVINEAIPSIHFNDST